MRWTFADRLICTACGKRRFDVIGGAGVLALHVPDLSPACGPGRSFVESSSLQGEYSVN